MRKNYIYAIAFIMLTVFVAVGYYLYLECRPVVYKNGTLVQQEDFNYEKRELCA